MFGAGVLFATMATFVGLAHHQDPGLSTLVSSAVRSGVNLVALLLLARFDLPLLLGDGRRALWVRGLLGGVSLISYFTALSRVGVGEAAFLNQTSAVWVAALAPRVLGEPTGRMTWLAVLGSLVGVALLGHPRDAEGDLLGRVGGLASGLFAAGAYVSIRRAGRTNGPLTIVFYFTLVASLVSVSACLLAGVGLPRDPLVWLYLAGSGLAATFAQLVMTSAYRMGKAGPVAAAGALGPPLNVLGGWLFLGQVPDGMAWIGMGVLLVSGMVLPFLAGRREG